MEDILASIKAFILTEFLPGEDPAALTPTTPLVTGGILDSLATLRLVEFLNETYQIEIQPHELTDEYLDDLNKITSLVRSKVV
jgi:acyl carrier protein